MSAQQYSQQIQNTLTQLQGAYGALFSGHPRMSRRPELLEGWLKTLEGLKRPLKLVSGAERAALEGEVKARTELYSAELKAIKALHALNEPTREAYLRTEWGGLIHDRYARHFAGQSRSTRDLHLLAEMIIDTQAHIAELEGLKEDERWGEVTEQAREDIGAYLDTLNERLKLYQGERDAITESASQGTHEERAGRLAWMANQLFDVYRAQYQGHPRSSRRLTTLSRVVASLSELLKQMEQLAGEFKEESHLKNINVVRQNRDLYTKEAEEVERAQAQLGFDEWFASLIEAAKRVHEDYREQYAGKARSECSPEGLVHLSDRLFDLISQLRPLTQDTPDDEERLLMQELFDQTRLYHREWIAVRTAHQPADAAATEQGH